MKYQVIVGNIGIVIDTDNLFEAMKTYNQYIAMSKAKFGRACGEDVTLMDHGNIRKEHIGYNHPVNF